MAPQARLDGLDSQEHRLIERFNIWLDQHWLLSWVIWLTQAVSIVAGTLYYEVWLSAFIAEHLCQFFSWPIPW